MTTIIVTHEDNSSSEHKFNLNKREITLGRRTTNDVCIPDLSVSGKHAVLKLTDAGIVFQDLHSTNGSYVNGQITQSVDLFADDDIILGKIVIRVISEQLSSSAINDQVASAGTGASAIGTTAGAVQAETQNTFSESARDTDSSQRLRSVPAAKQTNAAPHPFHEASDVATVSKAPGVAAGYATETDRPRQDASSFNKHTGHPLDGIESINKQAQADAASSKAVEQQSAKPTSAVIEIKNGLKSGQILPIEKPVTTLGRPGIQIAAIMRKPNGYFVMHIESDDTVERPKLNTDVIGDDPIMLNNGDQLTVAGIEVEFMLH